MRSPGAAIAWEFRQHHRWGFAAVIAYLFVLALIKLVGLSFDLDEESFALVIVVPLAATFIYFLAVFSFGLAGDLAARRSMYPGRMLTLPVTTGALAGWPMLCGGAAMAILWFATRLFGIWPPRFDVPIVWPALLAASLLAWTQALTWMPYPLPGLRVIVTVLWLAMIDAIVMVALELKASEPVMLAIIAPQLPLAYLAARSAVARARRGDVPDWRRGVTRSARIGGELSSPLDAQVWFEWRQYGRSLPALVGILLPFELAMLFLFRQTPELVFETFLFVLFTPPIMAAFVAATVSKPAGTFIATRPLTDASFIAARLRTTIRSTLAAWLLIAVAVPLALKFSGTASVVIERVQKLVDVFGMPRAIGLMLLVFLALLASTWKQLVQSLYAGMSGREWVVKASVFATLAFLSIALPVAHRVSKSRLAMAVLWTSLPKIAAVLVLLKISLAVWIAMRLRDRRLVSDRTLILGAVCWDLAVFALYGLLIWIFPAIVVRTYVLALLAILATPLARVSAAPLALAWSRHR